jgi:predicted ATP-dependent serine protease
VARRRAEAARASVVSQQGGSARKVGHHARRGGHHALQVADRAERLGLDDAGRVDILCENSMDAILAVLHERRPKLVILDSVQTVSLADVTGSNGSISQVRAAVHPVATLPALPQCACVTHSSVVCVPCNVR